MSLVRPACVCAALTLANTPLPPSLQANVEIQKTPRLFEAVVQSHFGHPPCVAPSLSCPLPKWTPPKSERVPTRGSAVPLELQPQQRSHGPPKKKRQTLATDKAMKPKSRGHRPRPKKKSPKRRRGARSRAPPRPSPSLPPSRPRGGLRFFFAAGRVVSGGSALQNGVGFLPFFGFCFPSEPAKQRKQKVGLPLRSTRNKWVPPPPTPSKRKKEKTDPAG